MYTRSRKISHIRTEKEFFMHTLFPRAVVLTGGRGVGKTTLVECLRKRGYLVLPDIAASLIQYSRAHGSDFLPSNPNRMIEFRTEVARRQLEQEVLLRERHELCFLDTGLLDGGGRLLASNSEIPYLISNNCRERYGMVIALDPLRGAVYPKNDRRIHDCILGAYRAHGYNLGILCSLNPDERANKLLRMVNVRPVVQL